MKKTKMQQHTSRVLPLQTVLELDGQYGIRDARTYPYAWPRPDDDITFECMERATEEDDDTFGRFILAMYITAGHTLLMDAYIYEEALAPVAAAAMQTWLMNYVQTVVTAAQSQTTQGE